MAPSISLLLGDTFLGMFCAWKGTFQGRGEFQVGQKLIKMAQMPQLRVAGVTQTVEPFEAHFCT
jgi:hypothetical protein